MEGTLRPSRRCAISARLQQHRMLTDVRFGSLGDITALIGDVSFTPRSGHPEDRPRMSAKVVSRPCNLELLLVGAGLAPPNY